MRILKYIFLLLLLSLVALSIFVATQKGDFNIERSKIIDSPKSTVFNYVNDYRNWQDFGSWTNEDPEVKITYSDNTIGKGASYSWEGKDGEGEMTTTFVKENDSISQQMDYNGTDSNVSWSFKDTIGGTKVTWRNKGSMNFWLKIHTALNGGINKIIGTIYEKSLANLDKALDYETNTYDVKINGVVKHNPVFYLAQSFTSELSKVNKNFKIVTPQLIVFCKKNDIIVNGKPFIIYHTNDLIKKLARISICVPIRDEIFISAGSDVRSGKLEAFEAVKITLTGDYTHMTTARDKAVAFLNKSRLIADPLFSHFEIYTVTKNEVKNPSKWVTEIYIPIAPKPIAVPKPYNAAPAITDSEAVPAAAKITPVKTTAPVPVTKTIEPTKKVTPKINTEEKSEF